MLVLDFETKAIGRRPHDYPPAPVGCAIVPAAVERPIGRSKVASRYFAWGHPDNTRTQNTLRVARADQARFLATVAQHDHWLCHHGGFDVAVAIERLGIPLPRRVDDTLFLLFLMDPYGEHSHSLKPAAEHYLQMPSTERDAVQAWLIENGVVTAKDQKWGAQISAAPSSVVGPYAIGDLTRPRALFELLRPQVEALGMGPAYEREVALLPMLVESEALGVPLDRKRLQRDLVEFEGHLAGAEKQIYRLLGKSFDIDSGHEFAEVLEAAGYKLPRTKPTKTFPEGQRRTAREALQDAIPPGKLLGWLTYRASLVQALRHFLRPWHATMEGANESVAHVKWNQVKDYEDAKAKGAKTGRMSSQPNFQNLTTGNTRARLIKQLRQLTGKTLPVPEIRSYVVAPKGYTLFGRDFSQQELKILAHFENGRLCEAYNENPDLDAHGVVREWMHDATGIWYDRDPTVKQVNFGKIFGMGVPGLAKKLRIGQQAAAMIIAAHRKALPEVQEFTEYMQEIGDNGGEIRTLGGRRYFAETPPLVDGKPGKSLAYRLTNYRIQGSAGDQTKEAMRNWYSLIKGTDTRFLLQVHDELVGMCPTKSVKARMRELNTCMVEAISLAVPQKTTGETGKNWGEMSEY